MLLRQSSHFQLSGIHKTAVWCRKFQTGVPRFPSRHPGFQSSRVCQTLRYSCDKIRHNLTHYQEWPELQQDPYVAKIVSVVDFIVAAPQMCRLLNIASRITRHRRLRHIAPALLRMMQRYKKRRTRKIRIYALETALWGRTFEGEVDKSRPNMVPTADLPIEEMATKRAKLTEV